MFAKYRWQICASIAASLFFAGLLITGVLHYDIWGQIEDLNQTEFDLGSGGINAHLPRFLVVSPSYLIANWLELDANSVFSWYVFLLVCVTAWMWLRVRIEVSKTPPTRYYGFLIPFLLAFVINGRFAFGLFGLSLILFIFVRAFLYGFRFWHVAAGLIGLLFTSVSSGIFTVGLLFIIFTIVEFARADKTGGRAQVRLLLFGLFFIALSIPVGGLFWIFFEKNVSYYGNGFEGVFNMLSHGFGFLMNPYPMVALCNSEGGSGFLCLVAGQLASSWFVIVMMGIALFCFTVSLAALLRKSGLVLLARRGIGLSILGGLFGITTLMSVIFILPIMMKKNKSKQVFAAK